MALDRASLAQRAQELEAVSYRLYVEEGMCVYIYVFVCIYGWIDGAWIFISPFTYTHTRIHTHLHTDKQLSKASENKIYA